MALELGFEVDPDADDLEYARLEDLASGNARADRPRGCDLGFEAGAVIIDVGGQSTRIEDALRYAVAGLCLRSVPALVDGSAYTYECFDFIGEVLLVPDGNSVLVSGNYVRSVTCPRIELMQSFIAVGRQFVELMPKILPGYEPYLKDVQRELDGARDALARR